MHELDLRKKNEEEPSVDDSDVHNNNDHGLQFCNKNGGGGAGRAPLMSGEGSRERP